MMMMMMMGGLLLPVVGALLLGLALVLLFLQFHGKEGPSSLPHGTMGLPLLGETLAFLKPHKSTSLGLFLQQHCSRYGSVFKSHLFGSPTIVSCDHELNMFILQNEERLFQVGYPKPMHNILGKYSLIIVSGEIHKKLRNFAVSFVGASKSTPEFHACIEKLSISMMESWRTSPQVSFHKQAKMFALNVMVKHLLSIEPGSPQASRILQDFLTYMRGFVSLPIPFPGTAYTKAVKARGRLSSTVKEIIEKRVRGNVENLSGCGDFLDVILNKGTLNNEEMVSIVLDLLLGGYETTATLMSLILYFLAHSPQPYQQLKEEHQTIRRSKKEGEALSWEDYKQMEFTSYVISEATRLGNVVKFVHRKSLEDVKFKGFVIPSGWNVLPVFSGAHFDQKLHEEPHEFKPWRWQDKELSKKVSPFGGGLRACPGVDLAKLEISFFLHHLVLNYRWKVKGDDYPLAYPFVEFTKGLLLDVEPIN